ncbi:MAG: HAD family hydrolase [Clostridiales bacterium]|nr:HAD family hydrolase [Clostridiales bacterium]
MNKLIIFDLDGTLIHSLPDIHEQVNITLEHFNYPLCTENQIRQYIGNGARHLIKCSFGNLTEEDLDQKLAYYNKIYTACGSPKTHVFEGMDKVMIALKERGYKLAILTNKPQITTDKVYQKYLSEYGFDMVVGQSNNVKCKPDKTATLNILKALNVKKENAYFIGDGQTDIETAYNADIKHIAVLWGYRDKDQLEKVGAKVFAQNPLDILEIIKK